MNRKLVLLALAALMLAGCGGSDNVLPDKAVEYRRETQAERNLELPPDLTSDRINDRMAVPDVFGDTSYSEYESDRRLRGVDGRPQQVSTGAVGVLPPNPDIEVRRDGDVRWLYVRTDADAVWDRLIDFWEDNGILLIEEDPTVGIMRTSWVENRAEISIDIVTNTIRRFLDGLYEAGTRDQFRIRLERISDSETEVFLTHYGMEEQVTETGGGDVANAIWVPRPRDPELEVEMLRRVMVYLGAADERARTQLAARSQRVETRSELINTSTGTELRIDETFSRAWRLVGLALDRVGFAVEDRDRSAGIFFVRYNDPSKEETDEGWLSGLKFWGDDVDKTQRYQVKVAQGADVTTVRVADEQGQPDDSRTAVRILTLLQEQIR